MIDIKRTLLLHEAVGLKEINDITEGKNDGLIRGISGKEGFVIGNWGIAFVQHCVERVDKIGSKLYPDWKSSTIKWTDDMMYFWQNMDKRCKKLRAVPGDIVVMHYVKHNQLVTSGQLGIVTNVNKDLTINTLEASIVSQFESSPLHMQVPGIHERHRTSKGTARMKVLGYFSPWIDR